MMYAKCSTIVMANNFLARGGGGGTYETPYTFKVILLSSVVFMFLRKTSVRQLLNTEAYLSKVAALMSTGTSYFS